ncbi:hypothetical protein [Halorubrum aethiopicum]|uniref:hypothetical protein n=1 Tax=Halorubrum aethiopicum TaxID=1758255 RepID=UPI000A69CAC3|nr:hypothetical protein [Halorubrum aethiopicum]
MKDDDVDLDFRDRIYNRALEEQNSNLWNFKRYYTAASFWSWVDVGSAVLTAFLGAILTYGLAWRTLPQWSMVSLSLLVGTISLAKANRKPGQRSEKLHDVGRSYQELHDDLQNFIELDLKDGTREKEWLRDRFEKLADKRHNLKAEAKLSGFWYRWLKWRREDEIYEEAITTDDERQHLDPDGFGNKN